jgi:hypothetical protein
MRAVYLGKIGAIRQSLGIHVDLERALTLRLKKLTLDLPIVSSHGHELGILKIANVIARGGVDIYFDLRHLSIPLFNRCNFKTDAMVSYPGQKIGLNPWNLNRLTRSLTWSKSQKILEIFFVSAP